MSISRCFPALFLVLSMPVFAGNSNRSVAHPAVVELPQRRFVSVFAPNRRWSLVATPFSTKHEEKLFLEDRRTGERTLLKAYGRDLAVSWSPDSSAFFLNNAYGSNVESAYIYWVGKEQPLKLDDLILNSDSEVRSVNADHAYFHVYRWQNSSSVNVEYCGHTNDVPVRQFHFLYRVDLHGGDGADADVHRISGKVWPFASFSSPECLHN
jgi:hypothetical protein